MEKSLLLIGLVLVSAALLLSQHHDHKSTLREKFNQFKLTYNKGYSLNEEHYRFQVYEKNMAYVEKYNAEKGFEIFGENNFSDLTDEEFASIYLTLRPDQDETIDRVILTSPKEELIDWRKKGAVTAIKDQGKCGSCWTFSTTGVLEGYFYVNTGELPSLSEQQLIDCSTLYDLNYGCNGGMPSRALNYVKRNGITTEVEYPYKAIQGECQKKGGAYRVDGHIYIDASEEGLLAALAIQPVSVGVDASNWKNYKPATQVVFEDCGDVLNHAVLVVAVDQESYIIKNSWSSAWGNSGFIHLKRGKSTCGVWNNMVIPK